jgi:hypothetical protein
MKSNSVTPEEVANTSQQQLVFSPNNGPSAIELMPRPADGQTSADDDHNRQNLVPEA